MTTDASPCISVCVLDRVTDCCIGCGRTSSEIAQWPMLSPDARRGINSALARRLQTMTSRATRQGGRRARTPTG
jgi:hypothetical protein